MALSLAQLHDVVIADRKTLAARKAPEGVECCADCAVPLMEAVTGNRRLGNGDHVCSDCYFERWGDEVESHPIFTPQILRGANR